MVNLIVGLIIIAILSLSITKIIREKRKGVKCVGCPLSAANNGGKGCSCH